MFKYKIEALAWALIVIVGLQVGGIATFYAEFASTHYWLGVLSCSVCAYVVGGAFVSSIKST